MTDLDLSDPSALSPREFAQWVKSSSSTQLAATMTGEHRDRILAEIFGRMPGLFRADRAGSTSTVIHWSISGRADGGADIFEIVIENGGCGVSPSPIREPKLAVTTGGVDFLHLITGNGNPMMMFMSGKLKARGDLSVATNLASLFELPKS